jgi:glycosyltransferase involved in cell wall biosynthesis
MRILLATDVFPPRCGGAGWSTYHLARALRQRGHEVLAVLPNEGARGQTERSFGGITVREFGYRAPAVPFLRNLFRNEILWPRLGRLLAALVLEGGFDLIHAQHSLTIPAAVHAGARIRTAPRGERATRVPVVATVRDYWPLCYRSTLLLGEQDPCDGCGPRAAARCLGAAQGSPKGRAPGFFSPLLTLLYPYVRGNVRRKARALAQADAVVAVSQHVAGRLAPIVPQERLHAIPNLVDLEEVERIAAHEPQTPLSGPFMLFVGKVEGNKGARELIAALGQVAPQVPANARLPLVVAGDGSLAAWARGELEAVGWPASFLRWAEHEEVLRLLKRTDLLLFPSRWAEPLSRVLLEACACGTPILAMATGGTPEIIEEGVSGALVPPDVEPFAARLLTLLEDETERRRLGTGARRVAEQRFAAPVVAGRLEELYRGLI